MTRKQPIVLALSRAARLEQQAGDPKLREQFLSAQACDEHRQKLLAEAWQLRADAGQAPRAIESTQQRNYRIAAKGGAS